MSRCTVCGGPQYGASAPDQPNRAVPSTLPTRVQYAHGGGRFYRGTHPLADYYDSPVGDLIERAFTAEASTRAEASPPPPEDTDR